MDSINVSSKYPELVKSAEVQGLKLTDVFAKVTTAGGVTTASYPMVDVDSAGHIPMESGQIVYDAGRLTAAQAYAAKNGEIAVKAKAAAVAQQVKATAGSETHAKGVLETHGHTGHESVFS